MRRKSSSLSFLSGLLLLIVCGCGGGGNNNQNDNPNDTPDYTVTISPPFASVQAGETQQFAATVKSPINKGVTWSVYGGGNCDGAACGTITAIGLYTAPTVVPNPATVHVKATSKDNAGSGAVATVTILSAVVVSVSPLAANVPVNGTQQFDASVQGTTNTAVTWSVSGSGCSAAACGTISDTGLYAAPSAVPVPATVTITATSQERPGKYGTATVTIGGSSLERLNGHYAFLLAGFDNWGRMHSAGSFLADGNGNVTGVQDINRASGPNAQISFTGTYTLGADGRGELVLINSLGMSSYRFALNADATEARMIQFDDSGTRSSGIFLSQNEPNVTTSTVSGDYILSFSGGNFGGARIAAIGRFHADGAGNLTNGMLDMNDCSAAPPAMANWTGTYAVGANGRGTAVLTIPGLGTIHFAFYAGYTNHTYISEPPALLFVSMDRISSSTPLLSGPVAQGYPVQYNNATWQPDSLKVFALAGLLPGSGTAGIVGTMQGDGAGAFSNGMFHENRIGVVSSASSFAGTYSIEPSGRGTGTLQLSPTNTIPVTFYLATPDRAVLLGTQGPDALLGFLWSMGGGGAPKSPSVFSGKYTIGPFAFPSSTATIFTGLMNSDGAGNFSGTQDISGPTDTSAGELIAGTYSFGTRGLGTANVSDGGQIALYMLTLDSELAMSIEPGDSLPVVYVMKR